MHECLRMRAVWYGCCFDVLLERSGRCDTWGGGWKQARSAPCVGNKKQASLGVMDTIPRFYRLVPGYVAVGVRL